MIGGNGVKVESHVVRVADREKLDSISLLHKIEVPVVIRPIDVINIIADSVCRRANEEEEEGMRQ